MSSLITPDYYETLELDRKATQEDIKEAYRNLSLRFNPKRATQSSQTFYNYKFHKIAEAYTVLSDPYKKGIYDNYGREALYKGITNKEGNFFGGFKYTGNAQEIFEKFMNETNPYSLLSEFEQRRDQLNSIFGSAFGGLNNPEDDPLPNILISLPCTLEELYNGCIKTVTYSKNTLNYDTRTTSLKETNLKVEILPGYGKDTKLTFKLKGNEAPGKKTSDVIVEIKEIEHPTFKRVNKNDLLYMHKISLKDALNSTPVIFHHLDGRMLNIAMDEIISPDTCKVVKGEGMPIIDQENVIESVAIDTQRGDLFIKFDIQFPDYINDKKKQRIIELLDGK